MGKPLAIATEAPKSAEAGSAGRSRRRTVVPFQVMEIDAEHPAGRVAHIEPDQQKALAWIRQNAAPGKTYRLIKVYGTFETKTVTKTAVVPVEDLI